MRWVEVGGSSVLSWTLELRMSQDISVDELDVCVEPAAPEISESLMECLCRTW